MPLNVKKLHSFVIDYQELSLELRQKADKALSFLLENQRHPSLQVKRIQGTKSLWEARVDLRHRITFQWQGNEIILRRIGHHDVIHKEARTDR